jgi:hypothetical protein
MTLGSRKKLLYMNPSPVYNFSVLVSAHNLEYFPRTWKETQQLCIVFEHSIFLKKFVLIISEMQTNIHYAFTCTDTPILWSQTFSFWPSSISKVWLPYLEYGRKKLEMCNKSERWDSTGLLNIWNYVVNYWKFVCQHRIRFSARTPPWS